MTREEAISWLKELTWHEGEDVPIYDTDVEAINMAIKALEQQPRKGHWIMTSDYLTTAYGSIDYVTCSCCGEDSLEEGDFCPNCGAKMDEEETHDTN